jgi:exonuclease-1
MNSDFPRYVDYAMYRVRMAQAFGVTPYMVFDGDFLPSKAATEQSRAKRREESRTVGLELLKAGKPSQAHLELQKAIDISPEMARHLIDHLRRANIPYVVAPYEADAQLVYLERQGVISGIISEDSDLLVFGARRLLTKMDQHGQCVEISRKDFCACREVALTGWTDADFRRMAILSGCDYLEGLPGMGLKTAYRMLRKYKTVERVVRIIQFEGKTRITPDYLARFRQAELTFLYQRVFCPEKKRLVLLTEADPIIDLNEMPFIGAALEVSLANGIASGEVNPITKEVMNGSIPPDTRPIQAPQRSVAQQAAAGAKRIDTYFDRNRRVPLAPMDPNCFSPEPRRVASLTMDGQRPIVFPLPRPYLEDQSNGTPGSQTQSGARRRATEPAGLTLRDRSNKYSSYTQRRTAACSPSEDVLDEGCIPRPSKKARLCEALPVNERLATPEKKSRFFGGSVRASSKATEESDTTLAVAETVEATLLSLPEPGQWNAPTSKTSAVTVFEETGRGSAVRQGSLAGEPDGVVTTLNLRDTHAPALSSAQDSPLYDNRFRSATPLTARSSAATSRFTDASTSTAPTPASTFLTPLQRISAKALGMRGGPAQKSFTPPIRVADLAGKASKRDGPSKSRPPLPINPSFIPLPRVDLAEVEALNQSLGSEDQILPNSDDENAAMSREKKHLDSSKQPGGKRLSLSRFMYS